MDQHGKEEVRKELCPDCDRPPWCLRDAVIAGNAFTPDSGCAEGICRQDDPALFILNTPCPPEWGLADFGAPDAARLALESRAVPNIIFDPDEGTTYLRMY